MTWDEHYRLWSEVSLKSAEEAGRRISEARKQIGQNIPEDWDWFAEALDHPERKWFVASLFRLHPVPKRLFGPMVRAAVLERNPSTNRAFVEPCVRSLGARRVLEKLLRYLETGTDAEKAGAASASYWAVGNPRNEELDELWERLRFQLLREFVRNPDLNVRRRIISKLSLEAEEYPEDLRPLIPAAIEIARSHPDEYIRHRVEIQLETPGVGATFMPVPDTGARF